MATNKKPTMSATSTAPQSTRPHRPPNARMVQNFHLVWLDESIDEINNDDCRNSISKIREAVNTVNTFIDIDECIDFITGIKEEKTLMLVSGAFSQNIFSIVQEISQVSSVYIFCNNQVQYENLAKEWAKVKGVYTDITSICEALKQAAKDCDQDSVSISFIYSSDGVPNENLDILDQSFMYTQILKEILLTMDFEQLHINDFLTYCHEQLAGNSAQLKNVEKIRNEYTHHQPIWWYTYDCFLYSMLNRALRLMEVDLIIKMGFFVRDLHNQIAALNAEQYGSQNHSNSFTVYRGQGLSQTDFGQLKRSEGGLIVFNNFLSTSLDRAISLAFAESNQYNPDLIGVLFKITIDTLVSATPFANVRNVSYYQADEYILFSMHSVFRIGQLVQIDGNNHLWQVDLTLTNDKDPQLNVLTARIQEETEGATGWHRLGQLMIKLGQFNKAQELYEILLKKTNNEGENAHLFHQLGTVKHNQGKYQEAITFYEKSLEILQKTIPTYHPNLATSYTNIGSVFNKMGEYLKALLFYEKALEIRQKSLPPNHPSLATSYNNISSVYRNIGEYSKALLFYKKAFEIRQKNLPPNHPLLATSYNNIGLVYDNMGEYSKALLFYEKALEIRQKTLPENHPSLATSYNNIGLVYDNMGEYSKALSFYKKALEIRRKTLPANHPSLGTSYNNIGLVYDNTGNYSKALSFYEKALEIDQKTLPANHPDLAYSYGKIGSVYRNMGEYSKALSFYEKALEIREKTLPEKHPSLANSYNNIGLVYHNMGEYSKALLFYEKALEIDQKTLPENHPDLANSYRNIGSVYNNMGEYSKALSFCEKAVEIFQITLPQNYSPLVLSHFNKATILKRLNRNEEAIKYATQTVVMVSHNAKLRQSEVQAYQKQLNELLTTLVSEEEMKKIKSKQWTYPVLLALSSLEKSRLYSIFKDLTDEHVMTPISIHEYKTNQHLNEEIKNIVVELSSISADENDDLLKIFSSIEHIESIYLLGKPSETKEERSELFTRFPKICVFCEDEGQLALRWAMDTAEECRALGDQFIKEGKKNIAREYFQRGMLLFDRLGTVIDPTKQQ